MGSVFSIVELENMKAAAAKPGGAQFLWTAEGRSIPKDGWEIGVTQRTSRTDYPGSEVPSEQVLGWHYEEFSLSGLWDDRYNYGGFAMETWTNLEKLVKKGSAVRLAFKNITLYGIIKNLKPLYKRDDRIEYEFTFSPHTRGVLDTVKRSEKKAPARLSVQQIGKLSQEDFAKVKAAQKLAQKNLLSSVQGILNTDPFREINAELDAIEEKLARLEAEINAPLNALQAGANTLSRAAQLLSSVRTSAQSALTKLQSVKSTTELAFETAANTLDFENWSRGLKAQLRLLCTASYERERDLASRAQPAALQLHRAKQNEDLRRISQMYYGTPFRWREIARANNLTKITLDGGELLVIPDSAGAK